jgi:predicted outer membrane repeat protein
MALPLQGGYALYNNGLLSFGGGMLNNESSSPTIRNCTFSGNKAGLGGGMLNRGASSPVVLNCMFTGNNATSYGGGIYKPGTVVNSVFWKNTSASPGGGIYCESGITPVITNCTFSQNKGSNGGAIVTGTAAAKISNCILWGKWEWRNLYLNGYGATVTNSIVKGGFAGAGNLDIYPWFKDTANGNLRLQPWSCAINGGNNAALPDTLTKDLDGNNRIHTGGAVDMGAYEYKGEKEAFTQPTITTNNSLHFDGVNDYVSVQTINDNCNSVSFGFSDAITVEYWFKGTTLQSAVRFQEGGNFIVAGWKKADNTLIHILSNDGGTTSGLPVGAAATDGNWHHVAFTWQRNTTNGFKSYLDGQLVAQRNSSNTALPAIQSLVLGSFAGTGEFTNRYASKM